MVRCLEAEASAARRAAVPHCPAVPAAVPVMPVLCPAASSVKMPQEGSASPAEKQDMVTLALAIVEKKVRNLEKRKVSLLIREVT